MKAETKALITVVSIVLLGGIFFVLSKDEQKSVTEESSSVDVSTSYSFKDVSAHKSKNDCWTIINGSVYDITSYVKGHPGGDNILSACGIDATEYFNGEKIGQEGGTNDHSSDSQALSQLSRLKIGELSN